MEEDPLLTAVKRIIFEARPLLALIRRRMELDAEEQEKMAQRMHPEPGALVVRRVSGLVELLRPTEPPVGDKAPSAPKENPEEIQPRIWKNQEVAVSVPKVNPEPKKPRMGNKVWSKDEFELLVALLKDHSMEETAKLMGRTFSAIAVATSRIRTGKIPGFVLPGKEGKK